MDQRMLLMEVPADRFYGGLARDGGYHDQKQRRDERHGDDGHEAEDGCPAGGAREQFHAGE